VIATVRQGHRYRAHLELGWLERVVSNATIESKLRAAGFGDVHVEGSGGSRWAFGTWPHPDASAELPSEIERVEEIG
jgi:hypothetical protein